MTPLSRRGYNVPALCGKAPKDALLQRRNNLTRSTPLSWTTPKQRLAEVQTHMHRQKISHNWKERTWRHKRVIFPAKGHRLLSPILHDGTGNRTSNKDSAIDSFCIKRRLHATEWSPSIPVVWCTRINLANRLSVFKRLVNVSKIPKKGEKQGRMKNSKQRAKQQDTCT